MAIVVIEGQASPKAVDILVRTIADPTISQENRESAVPWLRGANSAALAKATPDLIRQLGDANVGVRQSAVSLLGMIVDETRALVPSPAARK